MNKKKTRIIILIVSIGIFITMAIGLGLLLHGRAPIDQGATSATGDSSSSTSLEDMLPDNPIDFAKLRGSNEDIYAWIKIPNTKVDYPILQSYDEDDNFYMNHDENKKKTTSGAGSIYTQKKNKLDFSDRNTLIYGHHNSTGGMFSGLLKFKEEEFFNENQTIYIYTPGHILTYEIFAAYLYDDRHILNSFNFWDDDVYSAYLESCLNPRSLIKNVRVGVTLTTQDRIITLSTCNTWYGNEPVRYLVQGVLKNDERTK